MRPQNAITPNMADYTGDASRSESTLRPVNAQQCTDWTSLRKTDVDGEDVIDEDGKKNASSCFLNKALG